MRTTAKRLLAALLALLCCGPAFGIPAASAAPPSPANILTLEEALVLTNADQAAQCSFTPALGGFYTFHFQNNAAAQASNLSIEDAEGTLVYSGSYNKANNDYGSEHIFTAWLAGGKTYTYTHAFGLNGFNYALSVMREAVEPLGPGVLAEAAVPGNRFGSQSFAYFEFTAPAAGWYAFGSPTNPNLDGRLYTADGGYLGSEYGGKLHAQLTAGQTVIYAAGSLSAYSPLTVFVQVNAITPYTVTYDYNNGSGVKQTMNTPGKLGPYTPAKAGYEFAGWALTAGAAAAAYRNGDICPFTQDTTLYAVYDESIAETLSLGAPLRITLPRPNKQAAVTFTPETSGYYSFFISNVDAQGDYPYAYTSITNQADIYSSYSNSGQIPVTRYLAGGEDFTFVASFYNSGYGSFDINVAVPANIYTLSFDAQGGDGAPGPIVLPHQAGFPSPTREGYTFAGWRKSPDADSPYFNSNDLPLTQDTTIYAAWRMIYRAVLTLNTPVTVTTPDRDDDDIRFEFTPAESGTYLFQAASLDSPGVRLYIRTYFYGPGAANANYDFFGGADLFAGQTYTLCTDCGGGSWNGNAQQAGYGVTCTVTKVTPFTLTYNPNGGALYNGKVKQEYTPAKITDYTPYQDGYRFLCWTAARNDLSEYWLRDRPIAFTADKTVYAYFAPKEEWDEINQLMGSASYWYILFMIAAMAPETFLADPALDVEAKYQELLAGEPLIGSDDDAALYRAYKAGELAGAVERFNQAAEAMVYQYGNDYADGLIPDFMTFADYMFALGYDPTYREKFELEFPDGKYPQEDVDAYKAEYGTLMTAFEAHVPQTEPETPAETAAMYIGFLYAYIELFDSLNEAYNRVILHYLPFVLTDRETGTAVEGTLPPDTTLNVRSENFQIFEEILADAQVTLLRAYDITLRDGKGQAIQPEGMVTVRLYIPAGTEDRESLKVYRIEADGGKTDMNARLEGDYLVFETDHFSLYAVVRPAEQAPPLVLIDKAGLRAQLGLAKAILRGDYTAASWDVLQGAILLAQSVADRADATQAQVDAQLTALLNAIRALTENKTPITITAVAGKEYFTLWGKTTGWEKTLWNWILLIMCFGWIWMYFV